jgi:threonine dehydrogenase-like Zn-dependent dehydrogenase
MVQTTGGTKIQYLDIPYANVDTVIDCAGFSKESQGEPPLWRGLLMVKPNGKVIEVAVMEKPVELDLNIVMRKNIYLIGSWAWQPLEFLNALEMIKSGKVNRQPLITHTFPLSQAREAYEMQLKPNDAIKVILKP